MPSSLVVSKAYELQTRFESSCEMLLKLSLEGSTRRHSKLRKIESSMSTLLMHKPTSSVIPRDD